MKHFARTVPFGKLYYNLHVEVDAGNVRKVKGPEGLELFCYTEKCVYEKNWNEYTRTARGLILDPLNFQVVATPFEKFFNVGEHEQSLPALPFETFEKLDGSLIIVFFHKGKWRCATKGSFSSCQAGWADEQITRFEHLLEEGTTYLFEAIYTENRIVVRYNYEGLVLLGAYDPQGNEKCSEELCAIAARIACKMAARMNHGSVSELLEIVKILPATAEGFVVRFCNGLRVKIKGDEYCRIHRMVSRLTPLAVWESMSAGDDIEAMRKDLPEEFWVDFDTIVQLLSRKINTKIQQVMVAYRDLRLGELSDKELGLRLNEFPEDIRGFIFAWRRNNCDLLSGRSRKYLFNSIRPDGNRLDDYTPSSTFNRVMEEAK